MDIRMPEVLGSDHEHGPEHRWHERRGLNALDTWISAAVVTILIAMVAFILWVGIFYFVGEVALFS